MIWNSMKTLPLLLTALAIMPATALLASHQSWQRKKMPELRVWTE